MKVIEEKGNFFGEVKFLGVGKVRPQLKYGLTARKLRDGKGLTIDELAKELGLKNKQIEEIEAQTKGMTEEVMAKYCEFFGAKKEDFFDVDLDKAIIADNGFVLKTYENSERCRRAFDILLAKFENGDINEIIDFRTDFDVL